MKRTVTRPGSRKPVMVVEAREEPTACPREHRFCQDKLNLLKARVEYAENWVRVVETCVKI